jgi:hypothetical protein
MTLPDFSPVFKHIMTVDGTARVAVYNAMHDMLLAYAEQAVAAERERCAAICDARSADHWRAYSDKSSPHFCDARFEAFSDEAEECATLIRGDNAKVSGAGTASAGLPG